MLSWIVGIALIVGGVGWGFTSLFAASMADRPTTWWEHAGRPLTCLIPIACGILIIILR